MRAFGNFRTLFGSQMDVAIDLDALDEATIKQRTLGAIPRGTPLAVLIGIAVALYLIFFCPTDCH